MLNRLQATIGILVTALVSTSGYGQVLLGSGSGPQGGGSIVRVYVIDPVTGAATPITTTGVTGFLGGLATLGDEVFVTNMYEGDPFTGLVDLDTGGVDFFSDQAGSYNAQGLASNETTGVLYTVMFNLALGGVALHEIAPDGTVTPIGTTGPADGRGLAYDDANGILYAISLNDNLYTIDTETGASTLIGPTNVPPPGLDQAGLAYDEINEILYMNNGATKDLWTLDVNTGQASLVGANGLIESITGLAWLPPAAIEAAMDIRPNACPNIVNRDSQGYLPVALVGTSDFDVSDVDLASLSIARANGGGGDAWPNVGRPGPPAQVVDLTSPDAAGCGCGQPGPDGYADLVLQFRNSELAEALALDDYPAGGEIELVLRGTLEDGTAFAAYDCIWLLPSEGGGVLELSAPGGTDSLTADESR